MLVFKEKQGWEELLCIWFAFASQHWGPTSRVWRKNKSLQDRIMGVLVSAGIELIFFLVDGFSSWGRVPEVWKKGNVTPDFKKEDPRKYRPVRLTYILKKVIEWIILETISRRAQGSVIGSNQHEFVKGKLCLMNLIAICNTMTSLVEGVRTVDIVCVYLSKARHYTQFPIIQTNWWSTEEMVSGQCGRLKTV